jgi:hypothetical protein
MKEIKDLHLKADAVIFLFEQIVTTVPHEHFKDYVEEIMEKNSNPDDFFELNTKLTSMLLDSCIDFLYEDTVSKAKLKTLKDGILEYIEEELQLISEGEVLSERSVNYQRCVIKHLNIMGNYAELQISNLADKIKINIK